MRASRWLLTLLVAVLIGPDAALAQSAGSAPAEEAHALTLRLRRMRDHPSGFLPTYQDVKRAELARKILVLDSTVALAHVELGEWEAATYFQFRHALFVDEFAEDARRPPDPFRDVDFPAQREVAGAVVLDKSAPARAAYPRAVAHFERAVAAEPALRDAYAPLMRLYVAEEDYDAALAMLPAMQAHFADDPAPWLYAGMAHYFSDALPDAAARFDRAFGLMDPADRRVFDDLRVLLREQAAQQARYAQDDAFDAVAARFWALHDPRLLTPFNERRLEHYARLVYADLFFGDSDAGRPGWQTDIGQVLVRYGLPQRVEDQRAAERTPFGPAKTESGFRSWYYEDFKLDFIKEFPADPYLFTDYVRSGAQRVFYEVPPRTQYTPPALRQPLPFLASTFKGPGGRTDVYVAYGVPVPFGPPRKPLPLTLHTGLFLLHPDRGLALEQRRTFETLAAGQMADFGARRLWLNAQHVRVPAEAYELVVEFETGTGGVVGYERRPLAVPAYTGDALQLSDVLLAYGVEDAGGADEHGVVARRGLAIRPAPWGVFAPGEPLYLYVEVYNLRQRADGATAYAVEAVLAPWDGAGEVEKLLRSLFGGKTPGGVSVRFADSGSTPDDGRYLLLDTRAQPPGRYVLALRVTDTLTGESVEATREITLE